MYKKASKFISKNHANRKFYNWVLYDIFDFYLEKSVKYIKGDLVDLGCGEKPYEDFFRQYCNSYTGVDWSESLHDLKADIIVDLNEKLPIGDCSFDTIVSISVMEHLREPDIFLKECYRILREDGFIILQVPFMWHVHEAPHDYYRYTKYGLSYMFKKAGFKDIVELEATTGFWITWFVKLNYQLIKLNRGSIFKRLFFRVFIKKIIYMNQKIGFWLDSKKWNSDGETQGYIIISKK